MQQQNINNFPQQQQIYMNQNYNNNNNNNTNNQRNINMNVNNIMNTNNNNNNQKLFNMNLISQNTKNEVTEFISSIKGILSMPHTDERTEQLGEIIFYFLHEFIPKYNLNIIPNLDDTVLCSKLTGILINEDDNEILEIVSNNETIIMFIKNVIVVSFKNLLFNY
jgi:hypothetical protein